MPFLVRSVKRLMDIIFSLLVFIFLWPAFLVIAALIWLEDRGSPFYKQERLGLDSKSFMLYKFRTMIQDAEKHTGAVLQVTNDSRITRIGHFLRATRLDELPNFINVLLGDMSVVGPRAERPEIYNQVMGEFPLVWERTNLVKPGITGEAQIKLKSNGSLDEDSKFYHVISEDDQGKPENVVRYKMYYDFAYALKLLSFWSFLKTDISIIIRTPYVMFFNRNVV